MEGARGGCEDQAHAAVSKGDGEARGGQGRRDAGCAEKVAAQPRLRGVPKKSGSQNLILSIQSES